MMNNPMRAHEQQVTHGFATNNGVRIHYASLGQGPLIGAVAWTFARARPEMTEKLIVLNLPHPRGLMR